MDTSCFIDIIVKALTYFGGCFALYVFLQRVHNQTQQRALKAITDEIIKVNDFTIEFIVKYEILIDSDFDVKQASELMILKAKINAHLNYITDYINFFPYNGPVKYLYQEYIQDKYENKEKIVAEDIEFQYQDVIIRDSVLSIDIDFIENNNLKKLNDDVRVLSQNDIDQIIHLGSKLQNHLEENTRKFI